MVGGLIGGPEAEAAAEAKRKKTCSNTSIIVELTDTLTDLICFKESSDRFSFTFQRNFL